MFLIADGYFVNPGDTVVLEVSCPDCYLRLDLISISRGGKLDPSTSCSTVLPGNETELCDALASLNTSNQEDVLQVPCTLDPNEIAMLNNTGYHESFKVAINNVISSMALGGHWVNSGVPSTEEHYSDALYVLDVSEGFSIIPLIAAQLGKVKSYSSVEEEQHCVALQKLTERNGIAKESLEFWMNQLDTDDDVLQRPKSDKLWSIIILDVVEPCGLIRQEVMEKAAIAR